MIEIRIILVAALLYFTLSNSAKLEFDKTSYNFFGQTVEKHHVAIQGNNFNKNGFLCIDQEKDFYSGRSTVTILTNFCLIKNKIWVFLFRKKNVLRFEIYGQNLVLCN